MSLKAEAYYQDLSKVFGVFTNPIRLKILDVLITRCDYTKKACCVSDLNEVIGLPQPYISKHLKILKDNGIITYQREGNRIYYSFGDKQRLMQLIKFLERCCSECC